MQTEERSDEYKAILVHKIFENKDNGYGVALFNDCNAKGKKKKITCSGYYLPDNTNLTYIIKGSWTKHPKYGEQFSINDFDECVEKTSDGIIAYLSAGIIKGIGKVTAERIYDEFGDKSLDVIENTPEQLIKIKGITRKKLEKIIESYKDSKQSRELFKMLLPYGFTSNMISGVFSKYKYEAVEKIKENPYCMCDVKGISFEKVDYYVLKKELLMNSLNRFKAATKAVIKNVELSGNLGIEINNFGDEIVKKVSLKYYSKEEINKNTIELIRNGFIKCQKMDYGDGIKQYLYLKEMAKMEEDTATDICRIILQKEDMIRGMEDRISILEKQYKITLDKEQRYAIITSLSFPLCVISGSPGTGKTTIIKIVAEIYQQNYEDKDLIFLAPTGNAARRITESSGFTAYTIHKRLGLRADEVRVDELDTISDSLIFVDEFSMADAYIVRKLMSAIKNGCKLILVGDIDQLPSVGPGAVLRDIIESGICPVVFLKKIYRQGEDTQIYLNSDKIKKGITDIKEGKDFKIHECGHDLQKIEDTIVSIVVKRIEEYGLRNVLCLCPFKEHTAGVYALNNRIQKIVNPFSYDKKEMKYKDTTFRQGDLVMHVIKNTDEVVNGEYGEIKDIIQNGNEQIIEVNMNESIIEYKGDDLEYLVLAYATTIHKSQGSEAKAVISMLSGTAYDRPMLKRNMPYTAITRAKEMFDYVGSLDALMTAIKNVDTSKRITLLGYYLKILAGKFVNVN